jgi:RNA polymerase sigma-70 factor (ECF subfamily)
MAEELPHVLRRAAHGDTHAAGVLVGRYSEQLRLAVRSRLGSTLRTRVDTEDVVQATLVRAIANLSTLEYRGEKAFFSWLTSVADREIGLLARHHSAQKRTATREQRLEDAGPLAIDQTTASQAAMRNENRRRLEFAMLRLEEDERVAIRSRSYEGLSFQEIADRLALPDAESARTLYRRALRSLGRHMIG